MTEVLLALIDEQVAGVLTRSGGQLRFDYDDEYRCQPQAAPLSVG